MDERIKGKAKAKWKTLEKSERDRKDDKTKNTKERWRQRQIAEREEELMQRREQE